MASNATSAPLRRVFTWRSIFPALLTEEGVTGGAAFKWIWSRLGDVQNVQFLWSWLSPSGTMTAHWAMFAIGILWLSVIAFWPHVSHLFGRIFGAPESQPHEAQLLDSEIYRIVSAGKSSVTGLTRDLYRVTGKLEDFSMDADVLVEMYIVNPSEKTQYIRDFNGTVEIDGKVLPLIRQTDFYAWEFNGQDYEYCLNLGNVENKFDRSELESLPPLFPQMPIGIEALKPLEGWVHFIVKDIDPVKLDHNRSFKFVIVDSLGHEYPVSKASSTKRPGEVTTRRIPRRPNN